MNAAAQAMRFDNPRLIAPEDQARADYYALLASLFYRAPDERLLRAIAIAGAPEGEGAGELGAAWSALAMASAAMHAEAAEAEYEALFVGVGRPPVMLFGSFYLAGFMNEKPLAELRGDLARLGFARDPAAVEPEDHLAALCDVMRALILGGVNEAPAAVAAQRAFFARHLRPWTARCMDAVAADPGANYYCRVAAFARAFFDIEAKAFDI